MHAITEESRTAVEPHLPLLCDVAADLHSHPEIRFTEVHAARRLSAELEAAGFTLERGYAGLETAFVGTWSSPDAGADAPTIAIFCEFDALEGIGHACGHNLIAACGLGAGIAVREMVLADPRHPVHLRVVGSPGEEGGAGKVPMIGAGVLDGVDLAMMIHPSHLDQVDGSTMSRVALDVAFHGRPSHAAAAPERGRNALDAATLSLTAIGLLRQQLPDAVRIHSIITDGGQAPNIIPETTGLRVFVRTSDEALLHEDVLPRVEACFEGSATATGCTVRIEQNTPAYGALLSNPTLVEIATQAFAALGRPAVGGGSISGSTDMGNVSQVVPSIHPMIRLAEDVTPHTREFATAAGDPELARAVIADGSAILAATAIAAIRDPALIEAARSTVEAGAGR